MILREYQRDVVQDLREAFSKGHRHILLQAPTGSGKTVIASHIIDRAADKGSRVLFLAHRRELVHQCADKLMRFGCDHGLIMAGEFLQMSYEVQVASIDTLRVRAMEAKKMPMPKSDIIFIDECHRSLAPTYRKLMEHYPKAIIIGMTATPCRGDGKGLGDIYHHMVSCPSVSELIRLGHLVPLQYYAPTIPDLTGVKITAGDYNKKDLERAMNKQHLVGDILTHWQRIASDRPTIVFASGVDHSINLRDEFCKAGISAVHVDGQMSKAARDNAIAGLHDGTYQVATNCMVLTEGFDMPSLSACVLARPTRSMGLYLQMAGRTLRPDKGKEDTIIIDHSGNIYRHGFVEDERNWELTESRSLTMDHDKERKEKIAKSITCVKCATVYEGRLVCPNCGHTPERQGKYYETRHGELTRLSQKERKTAKKKVYTIQDKKMWYRMFRFHAAESGYSKGWASHKYKVKFKDWPLQAWTKKDYIETPTEECRSYIRYLNIRGAKAKEARERGTDNSRAVSR